MEKGSSSDYVYIVQILDSSSINAFWHEIGALPLDNFSKHFNVQNLVQYCMDIFMHISWRGLTVFWAAFTLRSFLLYLSTCNVCDLCRFRDWTSEHSLSSEMLFSGRRRRPFAYVGNVMRRAITWGLEVLKHIFHYHSLEDSTGKESKYRKKILDPQGPFLQKWNKIFVLSCVVAVSVDPLFFYVPVINRDKHCVALHSSLAITASVLRSFTDIFYILHIIFQFRTGFIAPPSRVFGRGVLVEDLSAIARLYLSSYFFVDILAVLPLPQVLHYIHLSGTCHNLVL